MAERRMFAKTIIDSDAFLDMPLSSQALYFHLSMRADDDGFINNPKKIQRMIGASDDDIRLLEAKRFIISFDSGVIVIKHWKIHNYIQKDRYKPTLYSEEKSLLNCKVNKAYSVADDEYKQNGYNLDTQVSLGKSRLANTNMSISDEILEGDFEEIESKKPGKKQLENDFELLWKLYPNKKGKKKAFESYKRAIKKGVTNKAIQNGIVAYKKEIHLLGTPIDKQKHGSTWFNNECWDDDYTLPGVTAKQSATDVDDIRKRMEEQENYLKELENER